MLLEAGNVVPADGRNRCYVNGKLASLSVLAELAAGLASVMGQHEHHALFDPAVQLALLDDYGVPRELRDEMASRHGALSTAATKRDALRAAERDRAARLDYARFQLEEIDRLSPAPDELDRIEREVKLLRHRGALLETARRGANDLYEADGSVFERLGALARSLEDAARHDESLAAEARQINDAVVLVAEAARSLGSYGARRSDGSCGSTDRIWRACSRRATPSPRMSRRSSGTRTRCGRPRPSSRRPGTPRRGPRAP